MSTADPLSKTPLRILNKGPEYFRSNNVSSRNSDHRRKTAAERLEADRLKYVKSAKARQRRATNESSHHNDSTGSHSMGTASTGSPVTVDDDDVSESVNNDVTNEMLLDRRLSGGLSSRSYTSGQSGHQKLSRSNTDMDVSYKNKFQNSNRFRHKSINSGQSSMSQGAPPGTKLKDLNCGPADRNSNRVQQSKDNRTEKSLSSYLSKAKEGIKAVTSTIAGNGNESNEATRGRQSRSTNTKSSKMRSASVGANLTRVRERTETTEVNPSKSNTSADVVMSPRSQLKHARQNLKKVGSTKQSSNSRGNPASNENENSSSPSKHIPKTFTVVPRNHLSHSSSKPEFSAENNHPALRENFSFPEKSAAIGRPLAVIENRVNENLASQNAMRNEPSKEKQSRSERSRRRSSLSGKDESTQKDNNNEVPNQNSSSVRRISSQRHKRRSLDIAQTMDNSLQLVMSKSPTSLTPEPDMMMSGPFSNTPRQRKSWSRVPPSTFECKKGGNRISYHEGDSGYQNQPGSRKSLTEALEEILNPLEADDDMDTAYNSMSPDASMDCKTLVGPAGYQEKNPTVVENSNTFLRGVGSDGSERLRSKTPESSRSKTSTGDDGISFGGNDVDITSKPSSATLTNLVSTQSSPGSSNRHSSGYRYDVPVRKNTSDQRQWLNSNDNQPLNRIDLAPTNNQMNSGIPNSPMLAPRSRREVAPEYSSKSMSNSLRRNPSKEEHLNTMKSQNTSSSASGDVNKPFTALTASDLKPRRGKRNNATHATPLKPTYPYPMSNNRGNTKRHNNGPASPAMSPHKQAAHMTQHHGSRSASSTPYSSLKRTPTSSRSSSLKRNRQRSKSDVSIFQSELDRFFSTMGMEEGVKSPLPMSQDTLFTTAHVSSESDFSFAGASAYVRDSPDESMDVDPATAGLAHVPPVSIIEKNARIMRWLMTCKKSMNSNTSPRSPRHTQSSMPPPPVPNRPVRLCNTPQAPFPAYPPPIPPRVSSYQKVPGNIPKESDV
ncbi:uncharacterized protein LOC143449434 isoform X1 [Clavelina lepadiformis]|uniref:uncharacterized protein LOC143449434 isoform X1 n=1 Tax=Clavelina lepadiformis TaxID=159417 RepID=UPI004041C4FE